MELRRRAGMWCEACAEPVTAQRRRRGFMEWLGRGQADPFAPSPEWHCPTCRGGVRRTLPSDLVTGDGVQVRLVAGGPRKIEAIRALRLHLGIDLRAARQLYDSAPAELGTVPPAVAERLVADLRGCGATVDTQP